MDTQAQAIEHTIRTAMNAEPLQFEQRIAGYIIKSQCTKGTASVRRIGIPSNRDSTMIARETDLNEFMKMHELRNK